MDGMAFRLQSMESIYRLLVFKSLKSRKAVVVFVAREFGYIGRLRKEEKLELWRARQSYGSAGGWNAGTMLPVTSEETRGGGGAYPVLSTHSFAGLIMVSCLSAVCCLRNPQSLPAQGLVYHHD